jgi:hypothetical protein
MTTLHDPYLKALVDAVERNAAPVKITAALTSGAVVTGFVRRSQLFASVEGSKARALLDEATSMKQTDDHTQRLAVQAQTLVDALLGANLEADSEFITLSDVTLIWASGDGLQLNAIRVALQAIAAWWVTPGQAIKGSKDAGGFWAVGVSI